MEAVVKWSPKGRALMATAVPVSAWLCWESFHSATRQPSPLLGVVAAVGTIAAVGFQLHLAIYRLSADSHGIIERTLFTTRRVSWNDVLKVEGIAQARGGGKIHRWAAAPEDAFHVIVHTRSSGRVSVHRWMSGVDDFIDALRVQRGGSVYRGGEASPLERDDATVTPILRASPVGDAVNAAYDGLMLFKAIVLVLPLSWIAGLLVTRSTGLAITGRLVIDGTLVALAPWGLGYLVYTWVVRVRARRFGDELASPPLSVKDAIFTMAAAMGGPLLLVGVVPMAIEKPDAASIGLALVGLFFCWIPVAEVRKALSNP